MPVVGAVHCIRSGRVATCRNRKLAFILVIVDNGQHPEDPTIMGPDLHDRWLEPGNHDAGNEAVDEAPFEPGYCMIRSR